MTSIQNKSLKKRILDISYKHKLSHLGSCLTAVDIIEEIYQKKRPDEKFLLSSGHAGLALYVVLEKHFGHNAEKLFLKHGVHPNRDPKNHIDCSAGSLGHGLPIAAGMALADRTTDVYCLISDGEMAEGSIWEALRIAKEQRLDNLEVHINFNGWGAYQEIDHMELLERAENWPANLRMLGHNTHPEIPFLYGQLGHYKVMTEEEYKQALEILNA